MLIIADTPGCTKESFCERAELFYYWTRACKIIPWLLPTIVLIRWPVRIGSEIKGSTFVRSEETPIVSWSEAGALFKMEKSGFAGRQVMMFDKAQASRKWNYGNRM